MAQQLLPSALHEHALYSPALRSIRPRRPGDTVNTVMDPLPSRAATMSSPSVTLPVETSNDSAVSWAAIFAGAAVAAALSLILLLLGMGFGLSSISPWAFEGVTAETFGWSTILWISLTSLFASGLGGYLAGRLRTRWVSVHGDETFFRDTAHGFLAWSVATIFTASLLTSTVGSILSMGAKAGATVAGGVADAAATAGAAGAGVAANAAGDETRETTSYFIDTLFRVDPNSGNAALSAPTPSSDSAAPSALAQAPATGALPPPPRDMASLREEAARIVANSLRTGALGPEDTQYLGRLIAAHSGLTQQDAEARVTETRARLQTSLDEAKTTVKAAADTARKAAARASLWLFITLLMGAFAASLMATFGGRQRDA